MPTVRTVFLLSAGGQTLANFTAANQAAIDAVRAAVNAAKAGTTTDLYALPVLSQSGYTQERHLDLTAVAQVYVTTQTY